jgi:predicted dehydrogenase
MIQKGVIGEVRTFHVYMAQDWSGWDWRGDPELSGGGQLNDSGSHYQDILLWMTGLLPVAVEGSMDCYHQGQRKQVPINGSFNVELSNGAGGRIIIVGDTIGGFRDDVRIAGDKGDLFFHEGVLYHRPHRQAIREVSCRLPRGYPRSPVDNFVRLVRGRSRKNRVPLVFGAAVATLTDAMLRAGETGERIGCEDLLRAADGSFDDIRFA